MKTIYLLLFALVVALPIQAQNSENLYKQLTDKYADKEGFSASQISRDMFDLYLKKRNISDDSPLANALKNLDNILVVSQNNASRAAVLVGEGYVKAGAVESETNKTDGNLIHGELLNYYKQGDYTLLKTEKRYGEDIKVYLKKNNEKISSLALLTSSPTSTNLVELKGDIDLKTVSELSGALNLRGLENLYKINNSGSARYTGGEFLSAPMIYSNPERLEELVARHKELSTGFELSDEQRAQYEKQAQLMAERQAEMAEKYKAIAEKNYKLNEEQMIKLEQQAKEMAAREMARAKKYQEMAEQYGRNPIFLSAPGDTNTVYYIDGKKVKADKIKELDQEKIESIEYKKGEKEGDKTKIYFKTK